MWLLNCCPLQWSAKLLLMGFNTDFPANDRIHYCYRPFYRALCSLSVTRSVSNYLTGLVRIIPYKDSGQNFPPVSKYYNMKANRGRRGG